MANEISKRDAVTFKSAAQVQAGRDVWNRSSRALTDPSGLNGRLANTSMNAEETAPKTWLLYKNAHKGEVQAIIECEIYINHRASDSSEMVGMLHGMCPECGETFIVREDNKGMTLGWVEFGRSTGHLRAQWTRHCREKLGRPPRSDDKIAVVSSPERWQCDYCKGWCVKVTDSVAIRDMTGATQMIIHGRPTESGIIPSASFKKETTP
jgi:predicted RNA-binding Zn-ribbon protein involved in translation (DUF1610 family)